VLTRDEVRAVIRQLHGIPRLMAILMYGSGLRLLECARLRVKDVDFARRQLIVRAGKGDKDRVTTLPTIITADLSRHLDTIKRQHEHTTPRTVPAGSSFRGRWPGSTPTPGVSGPGSGSSRPPASTSTEIPDSADDITCMSQSCDAPSRTPYAGPGSRSERRVTPCVISLPRTSWRTIATSGPSKNSWATATCARPCSAHLWTVPVRGIVRA
jgi:Phage integrase family